MARFSTASAFIAICLLITQHVSCRALFAGPRAFIVQQIQKAGNAADDQQRLKLLKELREHPRLDSQLAADTDRMIEFINQWTYGDDLWKFFYQPILEKDSYDFGIQPDSPLTPIANLYRVRMLIWVTMEYENRWRDLTHGNEIPARRHRFDMMRTILEDVHESFPANPIVRMYLGQPLRPKKRYHAVPGAPEWAVYQREGLERLSDIIEWWIDHRQQDDGQFGGDWGDDCEMWRWWEPVLVGFDDPKIGRAQTAFSRASLNRPQVKLGYVDHLWDVEHTAEETADALTPMMHLDPAGREWSRRALRLADLMENLWTARNQRGMRQFKSTFISATGVSDDPQLACDTVYHPKAIQPLLLYWQRTRDERIQRLVTSWMDTWVDAASRGERGKPAGILPSAIHWPSGNVGGREAPWWDPQNYPDSPELYQWPSALDLMTHTLLLAYHMTGQSKYVAPIRLMARTRLHYLKHPPADDPEAGSLAWCGSRLGDFAYFKRGNITRVLGKYRMLTADTAFDELLLADASPYVVYQIDQDQQRLALALRNTSEALRINFDGYTSEVRFTDRVLRLPRLFGAQGFYPGAIETIRVPDPALLYATVTGDPGSSGWLPLNAVRWRTRPRKIAVLVTNAGSDRFEAELFHFGKKIRALRADLFLLDPGDYTAILTAHGPTELGELLRRDIRIGPHGGTIGLELPPRQICRLQLRASHP